MLLKRHLIEGVIRNGGLSVADGPYKNLRMAREIHVALSKQGHKVPRDLVELYLVTRDVRPDHARPAGPTISGQVER
jgi:hypothetical protein